MSLLFRPFLTPVKYHELTPVELPQYISKQMEKYPFIDTIEEWEEMVDYPQLWQTSDSVNHQFTSGFGPITFKIIDKYGRVVVNTNFQQKLQHKYQPDMWVYEHEQLLTGLHGTYFFRLEVGSTSPTILISEPQYICTTIPNSVLLEYRHRSFYGDVFFETGIEFSVRVLGKVIYDSPGSDDTIFFDQRRKPLLITSVPYDTWKFLVGGSYGIPDYLIRRIARAFNCSFKSIDGIQYEKSAEGQKWEKNEFDDYPMRGWSIDIIETLDRDSVVSENGALQERAVTVVATINTDGFAAGTTGGEEQVKDFI